MRQKYSCPPKGVFCFLKVNAVKQISQLAAKWDAVISEVFGQFEGLGRQWKLFQELEARKLLGCIKVFHCIPVCPPELTLRPGKLLEVWPLSSWGKITARSGKTPALSPASQSCQSEWVQLGMKSPSWHHVLPVIFLFSQTLHMNCIGSTNLHQHAVWVLTLLCISLNEENCIGSTNFHQCDVWLLTLVHTSVNEIAAERWF